MILVPSSARGFTLIELLVVVAIISLLSSIVLTSLSTARSKANESTVKQNLSTIRQQAALYAESRGNYGVSQAEGACPTSGTSMFFADAVIRRAIQAAQIAGGGATRCSTNGSDFAVSVQLPATTTHWCLDSRGSVRSITNTAWTGALCP